MMNFATQFITDFGYVGVFLLMVFEQVIPAIPSEIVLPFIGHAVASNDMNFFVTLCVATAGSVVGTSFWFLIGWHLPADKLEKFLRKYGVYAAISVKDFHKARMFFTHYEVPAVFFGRMIPVIRGVISIPAGSVRMGLKPFFFYTTLGSLVWNGGLMYLGSAIFTDFTAAEVYLKPVTTILVYSFVANLIIYDIIKI
jgi:membrane protein DedA with SNARE-associated domain